MTKPAAVQGYGAGWLVEAQQRQVKMEKLEEEVKHYRARMLKTRLDARRQRTLHLVWCAWQRLTEVARRKQAERLAQMAGVATAVDSPEKRLLQSSALTSAARMLGHAEWWERGSPPKPKRKPKAAPVNLQSMV